MSDYGASITIIKKDGKSITDFDKNSVIELLKEFKSKNSLEDVYGNKFLYEVNEFSNDDTMLDLLFTRYYFGDVSDEENEKIFNSAKLNDLPKIKKIADFLQPTLNEVFNFDITFESW
ncbi:hypothetical protein IF125_14070 [Empedobacter stercoris]|uniref:hypothetical protein n=1 Tax=Empedobacter stercoris TaxID=1628248 RepID=UPI001CE02D8C|nr:hypothetical protein [Empedobacter stercoris]MCA4783361.1 hypothetical protein [Empedobacter stercoris]